MLTGRLVKAVKTVVRVKESLRSITTVTKDTKVGIVGYGNVGKLSSDQGEASVRRQVQAKGVTAVHVGGSLIPEIGAALTSHPRFQLPGSCKQ